MRNLHLDSAWQNAGCYFKTNNRPKLEVKRLTAEMKNWFSFWGDPQIRRSCGLWGLTLASTDQPAGESTRWRKWGRNSLVTVFGWSDSRNGLLLPSICNAQWLSTDRFTSVDCSSSLVLIWSSETSIELWSIEEFSQPYVNSSPTMTLMSSKAA